MTFYRYSGLEKPKYYYQMHREKNYLFKTKLTSDQRLLNHLNHLNHLNQAQAEALIDLMTIDIPDLAELFDVIEKLFTFNRPNEIFTFGDELKDALLFSTEKEVNLVKSSKDQFVDDNFELHINPELIIDKDPMKNLNKQDSELMKELLKNKSKRNEFRYIKEEDVENDAIDIILDLFEDKQD